MQIISDWIFKKQLLRFMTATDTIQQNNIPKMIKRMTERKENFDVLFSFPLMPQQLFVQLCIDYGNTLTDNDTETLSDYKKWFLHAINNDFYSHFVNKEESYQFFDRHFDSLLHKLEVYSHHNFIAFTLERVLTGEYQKDKIIDKVLTETELSIQEDGFHYYFISCFPDLFNAKPEQLDRIYSIFDTMDKKYPTELYSANFIDDVYYSGLFIHDRFHHFMKQSHLSSTADEKIEEGLSFLKGAFFHYLQNKITFKQMETTYFLVKEDFLHIQSESESQKDKLTTMLSHFFFEFNLFMHSGVRIKDLNHYQFYSERSDNFMDFLKLINRDNGIIKETIFYSLLNNENTIYKPVEFYSLFISEAKNINFDLESGLSNAFIFNSVYQTPNLKPNDFKLFIESYPDFQQAVIHFSTLLNDIFKEKLTQFKKIPNPSSWKEQSLWQYEKDQPIIQVILDKTDLLNNQELSDNCYLQLIDAYNASVNFWHFDKNKELPVAFAKHHISQIISHLCQNILNNKLSVSSSFFDKIANHEDDYSNAASEEMQKYIINCFKEQPFLNIANSANTFEDIKISVEKFSLNQRITTTPQNKIVNRL